MWIEATKLPKLQVTERGLNSLVIEACGLPLHGKVEVQTYQGDRWQAALPAVEANSDKMTFTLSELEENSSHRLRLRTIIELEPLRLEFAQFMSGSKPPASQDFSNQATTSNGEGSSDDTEEPIYDENADEYDENAHNNGVSETGKQVVKLMWGNSGIAL